MHITHELLIDCSSITATECSDKCLEALGHGVDFNLKASTATDTCHGSVSIDHGTPHIITVECYEHDEAPTAVMSHSVMAGRQSTLACCESMPTEQEIIDRLNTLRMEQPK